MKDNIIYAFNSLLDNPTFKAEVKHSLRVYPPNKKIIEQNKLSTNFYLIKSGTVRVLIRGDLEGGKNLHPGICDLGPDEIFGELGLFDNLPASADVISLTES